MSEEELIPPAEAPDKIPAEEGEGEKPEEAAEGEAASPDAADPPKEDDQAPDDGNDYYQTLLDNESKRQDKKIRVYFVLSLALSSFLFLVFTLKLSSETDNLQILAKEAPYVNKYIAYNMGFYKAQLAFYVISLVFFRFKTNFTYWVKFEGMFWSYSLFLGIWGWKLLGCASYTAAQAKAAKAKHPFQYYYFNNTLYWMWLARAFFFMAAVFLTFLSMIIGLSCAAIESRAKSRRRAEREREQKAECDEVIEWINSYAKDFKAGAIEVEKCAQCEEEFTEEAGKQIIESNCDPKHIFHVDCLVKSCQDGNSRCPTCYGSIHEHAPDAQAEEAPAEDTPAEDAPAAEGEEQCM